MSNSELKGLSGWLILVAIGVVVTPIRLYFSTFPMYGDIFSNGSWYFLTNQSSTGYVSGFAPLLIIEMAINLFLVSGFIYLAFLFFSKRSTFPKTYITLIVFSLIHVLVNASMTQWIFPEQPFFDAATSKAFITGVISALIWIPYMIRSKRVKNTFTVEHNNISIVKHMMIIFVCLGIPYSLYITSIKTEPKITSVKQQLIEIANKVNKTLPQMLDSETKLDSVSASGHELQYRYILVNYNSVDLDADLLTSNMRPNLVSSACSTEAILNFLNEDVLIKYSYFDKLGVHVTSIDIKKSDCD
ncbi:DUF2569 domain-containing protein [Vibrio barjaei]|uniref:DUF2569 domain-containing protein n=1 Tax=Vibrio barjaei TaxID=1676683 RepID=A0ABW7IIF2_9VIBR